MLVLGLQIDAPLVRAALVKVSQGKVEISALKSAPLAHPKDVKELYTPKFSGKIVTGLSGKDIFIQPVELEIAKSRHLEQALAFQSEIASDLASEEVVKVPYITKRDAKGVEALLFHASERSLREHLAECESIGVDPDQVGAWSSAIVRYIGWKLPTLTDAFVVDLGSSEWSVLWIEKGVLKKAYTIQGGMEALLSAFWEDQKTAILLKELDWIAKQTDVSKIGPYEIPTLFEKISTMRQELAKVIFSFYKAAGANPILYTGRVDAFRGVREFLNGAYREAISKECNSSLPLEELKYAVSIGLALDPMLQFRQGELFPKKTWRKAGMSAVSFWLLSLLTSSALYFFGSQFLQEKREALVSSLKSSMGAWEMVAQTEDPEVLLEEWLGAVQKFSKEYPYIVLAPKVSGTLHWLNNHPLVRSFAAEGDPLKIVGFHYELVQFPRIGAQKETYKAKVELEFEVKSPLIARKFHEFLLKEKNAIDLDEEVSWNVQENSYRTTFYLKNRKPHVL